MKTLTFAGRNAKEILRDPINLFFGLFFPIVLLLLLSAIGANIPENFYEIQDLAPGITVFGLSFMTLFSATLVSKDRESAFLQRLYTTPLSACDFIVGYMLPLLTIALVQTVLCYLFSSLLGLSLGTTVIIAVIGIIPMSIFNISLGLLCGSVLNSKQVGGICGALLTNLSAWLSGVWFDLSLVGGAFEKIADFLPFVHAVKAEIALLSGDYQSALPHLPVIFGYAMLTTVFAVILFLKQMKKQ